MSSPLVSICIPVKNMERTIEQTVRSALSQTYQDVEILVVDNQSTDRTRELILAMTDPRLRLVQNEQDLGVFGNHNRCVEVAEGEWIKFLHGDDLLHPECVQQMVTLCDGATASSVGCVSCGAIELGLTDYEERRTAIPLRPLVLSGRSFFNAVPRFGNFVGTPSMTLLRKDAVRRVGGFDPVRRHSGDLDCWLRLSQHYDFAFVPAHLVSIRNDPPPVDPAKKYDYTAILHQLAIHHRWFFGELGGDPLWNSPLGRWMCRESVLYVLAYAAEAFRGRPEPLRQLMSAMQEYHLLPQLAIQVSLRGPAVLFRRVFPSRRWTYAGVAEFFATQCG